MILAKILKSLAAVRGMIARFRKPPIGRDGRRSNDECDQLFAQAVSAFERAAKLMPELQGGASHLTPEVLARVNAATKNFPGLIPELIRVRDRALQVGDEKTARQSKILIRQLRTAYEGVEAIDDAAILSSHYLSN